MKAESYRHVPSIEMTQSLRPVLKANFECVDFGGFKRTPGKIASI